MNKKEPFKYLVVQITGGGFKHEIKWSTDSISGAVAIANALKLENPDAEYRIYEVLL